MAKYLMIDEEFAMFEFHKDIESRKDFINRYTLNSSYLISDKMPKDTIKELGLRIFFRKY